METVSEMARSIVIGKKKRIRIKSLWNYVPNYDISSGKVPALVRQTDSCRVAMAHLEMANDPAEYEIALKVIKEVKRLIGEQT